MQKQPRITVACVLALQKFKFMNVSAYGESPPVPVKLVYYNVIIGMYLILFFSSML